MRNIVNNINTAPLFDHILLLISGNQSLYQFQKENLPVMLGCIGYHLRSYSKGDSVSLEDETIDHVGIVLSGAVDMIKEDVWGNRTLLIRLHEHELFGETFTCSDQVRSVVTFLASENAEILFLPFRKVMHTCSSACIFHHQLIENMVRLIADKNLTLIRKIEVISKKTLREKILAYLSIQSQIHDTRYFEIPLGRIELADYLCADRSALTRELSSMKKDGLIDFDKNMFRIL